MLSRALIVAFVLALGAPLASRAQPVVPQQPIPPETYTLDPRGVDLISRRFNHATTEVVIGQPGTGGLVYGRVYLGGPARWRDSQIGTINVDTTPAKDLYTVSVGGGSQLFEIEPDGSFTPRIANGATLVRADGIYTYTTSQGGVAEFSTNFANELGPYTANVAAITSFTAPNGERLRYNYNRGCALVVAGVCEVDAYRLISVTNNFGYQMRYRYANNQDATSADWYRLIGVVGFNMVNEACAPTVSTCTLQASWPQVNYSSSGAVETVTDELLRTTTYTFDNDRLSGVRLPGSALDDLTVTYESAGSPLVSEAVDGSGVWNYAFTTVDGASVTRSRGPPETRDPTSTYSSLIFRNTDLQRADRVRNAFGHDWVYRYDADRRLDRVTNPEGDAVTLTHDDRGNVLTTTWTPKVAGPAPIVTTAGYPNACTPTTIRTCNRPLWTRDANNQGASDDRRTDYVWSDDHGGLVSVTRPVAPNGIRPQVRYGYQSLNAFYQGTADADPVTLPVSTSTCATQAEASCVGTADEVRTTVTYGSPGVNNNLLPTSVSSGSGNGSLTATTTMLYTPAGDVAQRDGPLTDVTDLTVYRYNVGRELEGVIGPDPDGGGGLLHRATRFTYNARGDVTLVRAGTTASYNDPQWTTFVTLQQRETTYEDRFGRVQRVIDRAADGTRHAVTHFTYQQSTGWLQCAAVRMNPTAFLSDPADGACGQTQLGGFGPDRIVRTEYDRLGRANAVTRGYGQPEAITEQVTFTPNGQPLFLVQGPIGPTQRSVSRLSYDGFDRLRRLNYPNPVDGGVNENDDEEWEYDPAGNVIAYTDRANQSFTSTYDALSRLRTYAFGGPSNTRTYTYDNLDRPLQLSTPSPPGWLFQWTWDALSRQTGELGPLGTMASQYDLAGRRTRLTWPDEFYVTYYRLVTGELQAAAANGASSGPGVLANYGYDNLGRRVLMSRGNGVVSYYGWDPVSRLEAITHDAAGTAGDVSLFFTHNPAGQIVTRTATNSAYDVARPFLYDELTYDRLNRLTVFSRNFVPSAVTYDDARSNIAQAFGRSFTYDAENNLSSASGPTGTSSYGDDPLGRSWSSSNPPLRRQWAGEQLVRESDPDALYVVGNRYIPGDALNEAIVNYAGPTALEPTWPLLDERGGVISLTDDAGVAATPTVYDDYGLVRGGPISRFGYTGQVNLLGDLQDMHARAYQPILGRFLQPDPLGYAAGMNLYGYVGGDPVNRVDPLGLETISVALNGQVVTCIVNNTIPTRPDLPREGPPVYGCRSTETQATSLGSSRSGLPGSASTSTSGGNSPGTQVLDVAYQGRFHDSQVAALQAYLATQGVTAYREVPICLVAQPTCIRADLFGRDPRFGGLFVIEVKTGRRPTFTSNQIIVYPHLAPGGLAAVVSNRAAEFGVLSGSPLPPVSGYLFYRVDQSTPAYIVPF